MTEKSRASEVENGSWQKRLEKAEFDGIEFSEAMEGLIKPIYNIVFDQLTLTFRHEIFSGIYACVALDRDKKVFQIYMGCDHGLERSHARELGLFRSNIETMIRGAIEQLDAENKVD